jgi:hypothetical protein
MTHPAGGYGCNCVPMHARGDATGHRLNFYAAAVAVSGVELLL